MTEIENEVKKQLLECARQYEFCEFGAFCERVMRNEEWMAALRETDSIDNVLMECFQSAHGREYPRQIRKVLLKMYGIGRGT